MRIEGSLLKDKLLNGSRLDEKIKTEGNDAARTTVAESKIMHSIQVKPYKGYMNGNSEKNRKEQVSSIEEITENAQNAKLSMANQNLSYIANNVTPLDSMLANKEGYDPMNMSSEAYVTVIDKIKINMAIGNDDFKLYGDAIKAEDIESVAGRGSFNSKLAAKLSKWDVPVNEDNLSRAGKAVMEGEKLSPLSEGDKKYLIENDVLPTVENLYKAQFGSMENAATEPKAELWQQLSQQAEGIIEEAGLEVNEDSIADAKWLLANEIPIESESLYAREFYNQLKLPQTEDAIMESVAIAMNRGNKPMEAVLLPDNKDLKFITTKRQLQEARIMMTMEGKRAMEANGMKVDIQEMSKELDALKEEEKNFYSKLLSAEGIEASEENIDIMTSTREMVSQMKQLPEYILAKKVLEKTLPQNVAEGQQLASALQRLNERYETVMTRPRADMGDSINKAFANIPAILSELGMEATADNAKAVRILAYNQMPINTDNITEMKNIVEGVNAALDELKPATVLSMIRNNTNPLEMTMSQLLEEATAINKAADYDGTEKYSEFLWKLSNTNGISPEERESFIGIYRMLRSIEKTDGAVIGSLINQTSELTIKNLMTAVRSRKNAGINTVISEGSQLSSVNAEEILTVTRQAETAFSNKNNDANQNPEAKYNTMLARKLLNNMQPADLKDAEIKKPLENQTIEELADNINLAYQVDQAKAEENARLDLKYEQIRLNRYESACSAEDEVIRALIDNDLPVNLANIIAEKNLQLRRNSRFDKLFKTGDAQSFDEIKAEILHKMGESIKTPAELAESLEKLGDLAESVMDTMINEPAANYFSIQNSRMLHNEIHLMGRLAKKETYEIPVLIGDSVTGVSLKIVRGKKEKGRVDVVFDLGREKGGKVAAELIVKDKSISGMIAAENEDIINSLREGSQEFIDSLGFIEDKNPEISYAVVPNLTLEKFMQGQSIISNENDEEMTHIQTRNLYGMAKEFLSYVNQVIGR